MSDFGRAAWRRTTAYIGFLIFLMLVVLNPGAGLAESVMTISGTVSDAGGLPIAGARVIDGTGKATYTDSLGQYRIDEDLPGNYTITVLKSGLITKSRRVGPLDALDSIDFTMMYAITSSITKWAISTAHGPGSSTLNVTSFARFPGSCVYVTDSRIGQTVLAAFDSQDSARGSTLWKYTTEPPQDTQEESFNLNYIAKECATGVVLSNVPTPMTYGIDNTPPEIDYFSHSSASDPAVTAIVHDVRSGIDIASIEVTLDGDPLTYMYTSGKLTAPAPSAADGIHSARIVVSDNAGNATDVTFTFIVDGTFPDVSSKSPAGTIQDRSPNIAAIASDDIGIDHSSIVLRLAGPLGENTLQAQYDSSSGLVSFKVPELPRGAGTGEGPLLDGTYLVILEVADLGGNLTVVSWPFTVSTLL